MVLLSIVLWSCVDIPETGPQIPDPQTFTRYMHLASGIDTISFTLNSVADTSKTGQSNTIISGSDTIAWSDSFTVITTKSYFKRYQVDFSSSLSLKVDNVPLGNLSYGDATVYQNIPSGNRKLKLYMSGAHIDTVEYIKIDTNHVVKRDTVGKGKYRFDSSYTVKSFFFHGVASTITEEVIADSTSPSLLHNSFEKATVFLMRRDAPLFNDIHESIRYGLIKFEFGGERRNFSPSPTDSITIRFVNVTSGSAGKRLTVRGKSNFDTTVTLTAMIDSLGNNSLSSFLKLYNGAYSFYLSNGGSTIYVDSIPNVVLTGGRRLTFTATKMDDMVHIRKYNDD
jgi:hypothetical protein